MDTTHPACTLHNQNVKFPFPIASEVLKECSLGGLPVFCVAIWGSILGGAHELKQQRIPTLKHFRHVNFYYNLNYVNTGLRKRKTWLPNFFFSFPFHEFIHFSSGYKLSDGALYVHINDAQGITTSCRPPSTTSHCVSNLILPHFSRHEVFQ